jgi:BirA family biotin operon repressor/biotin-[acetyl-CoA-carboxylase] ligase
MHLKPIYNWPRSLIIKEFDYLDSTNDEAKRLALLSNDDYLIIANVQTKGRGRSGKEWVSKPGNLYFSLLIKEDYPASYLNAFPAIVSLAIADALVDCGLERSKVQLKWPNDILVNEKKIAGILLESKINLKNNKLDYLIIGCGINIESFPEITTYTATSFYEEQKQVIDKSFLIDVLLKKINDYMDVFEKEQLQAIIALWCLREWGIGREVSLLLKEREVKGIYKGVNTTGAAVIEDKNGELLIINSGEVFFN